MDFDESRRKAFDFCADATKQLITLSTAIVAFTVTFAKDFLGSVPAEFRGLAYLAWGAHVLSILFGLVVLLALTAQLQPKKPPAAGYVPSIRGAPATYSGLQIAAFLAAMVLTAYFGYRTAGAPPQAAPGDAALQRLQARVDTVERHVTQLQGELAAQVKARAEDEVRIEARMQAQVSQLSQQAQALRRRLERQCVPPAVPSAACCQGGCGR